MNNFLSNFGLSLVNLDNFNKLLVVRNQQSAIELIHFLNPSLLNQFVQNINFSKSQLDQDLFTLSELNFKIDGFIVEFGATGWVNLSNTFLMEKKFNWRVTLAEPAKEWHKKLNKNRSVLLKGIVFGILQIKH